MNVEAHLVDNERKRTDADSKPSFRVKRNHSGLAEGVDPLHLNRLIDDLEVEEFLARNEAESGSRPTQ